MVRLSEKSFVLFIQYPPDEATSSLAPNIFYPEIHEVDLWPNIFYPEIHEVDLWQVYIMVKIQ